ncbi:MAG: cytochrome c oxidase accessory protein CcoG [Rhizobiaceae bacterium]|nr:cytochrome c oxidase accessory protein CcoG [Rhizobiaceae bacterium]
MSWSETLDLRTSGRVVVRPDIPHGVSGRYRRIKTALNVAMLAIFFCVPWLRWDRGPHLPDQAVLIDLPGRRLFAFGLEFWPQDLPIAVGVLVGAALLLFYATTLAGRIWCGFACPQTVWSDLLFSVDRMIARVAGRGPGERRLRVVVWFAIALSTASGFAAWFNDATELPGLIVSGTATPGVYASLVILTGTTFTLALYARERVCLHMCPWPRFQAALLDRDSLVVTYQEWRGEPRGKARVPLRPDIGEPGLVALARQASDLGGQLAERGDCIDCTRCVTACPTGVDIRNGLQMGCIGCGLCIDACDQVMSRLERPAGLIQFDNEAGLTRRSVEKPPVSWRRPKALVFAGAALAALSISAYGAATMPGLLVHLDPQRNPPFVLMSDGSVRNDYALRISHRLARLDGVSIRIDGLDGAKLTLSAGTESASGTPLVGLGRDRSADERLLVTLPRGLSFGGRRPFDFVLSSQDGRELARVPSYFWGPER